MRVTPPVSLAAGGSGTTPRFFESVEGAAVNLPAPATLHIVFVPEPTSFTLLALGSLTLVMERRKH